MCYLSLGNCTPKVGVFGRLTEEVVTTGTYRRHFLFDDVARTRPSSTRLDAEVLKYLENGGSVVSNKQYKTVAAVVEGGRPCTDGKVLQ